MLLPQDISSRTVFLMNTYTFAVRSRCNFKDQFPSVRYSGGFQFPHEVRKALMKILWPMENTALHIVSEVSGILGAFLAPCFLCDLTPFDVLGKRRW